jgi:hypothetical protein
MPQRHAHLNSLSEHIELFTRTGWRHGGRKLIAVIGHKIFVVTVSKNRFEYISHLPHQSHLPKNTLPWITNETHREGLIQVQ